MEILPFYTHQKGKGIQKLATKKSREKEREKEKERERERERERHNTPDEIGSADQLRSVLAALLKIAYSSCVTGIYNYRVACNMDSGKQRSSTCNWGWWWLS